MTQYSYQLQKKKYGDYRDLIQELVDINPGQISFDEYNYMFKIIKEKSGCNLLIFGLGKDSHMWTQCNYDGKTTFLENDPSWITAAKNTIPDLDVRTVEYDSHGYDADDLLNEFKDGKDSLSLKLDDDIRDIEWDVVLVDAPAGYHPNKPGRMKSIYESFNFLPWKCFINKNSSSIMLSKASSSKR